MGRREPFKLYRCVSQSRNAFPDFLSLNLANYSPKVAVGNQLSSVLLNLTSPFLSSLLNLLPTASLNPRLLANQFARLSPRERFNSR
jgi:hypothetical protein